MLGLPCAAGDETPDPTTVRLFKSLPNLRRLRMVDGRIEVSSAALCHVSRLAPTLTSLDFETMYLVDDAVPAAIGELHGLRRLRLMSTSFSAGGIGQLSRLAALTQLALINSAGVMSPFDLTDALIQVRKSYERGFPGHQLCYIMSGATGYSWVWIPLVSVVRGVPGRIPFLRP